MTILRGRHVAAENEGVDRGFTLIEIMMAMVIVLVVAAGMASFYTMSLKSNTLNAVNVQLLSSARAKLEQIQSIPYEQVGINASGVTTGPGYFVVDPVYNPVYNAANGDIALSDTVTLTNGRVVTRTVTVAAVDDAADGTGVNDSDGVTEPNTGTILDYKLVTVKASTTVNNLVLNQTLTTYLQGDLPVEEEGATGTDSNGTPPAKVGTPPAKMPPAPPAPPAGCDIADPPGGKDPGKKGASPQSPC
jgi:prepilin-type N-terminal cleavage/methylation domain-containing protein